MLSTDIGWSTQIYNLQFICEFKDTVVDRKDCTPALLWSKATQTTGGVDGIWEDPPN